MSKQKIYIVVGIADDKSHWVVYAFRTKAEATRYAVRCKKEADAGRYDKEQEQLRKYGSIYLPAGQKPATPDSVNYEVWTTNLND